MNSFQRRLFRAFADGGGDLSEDDQVERFIRYVVHNPVKAGLAASAAAWPWSSGRLRK